MALFAYSEAGRRSVLAYCQARCQVMPARLRGVRLTTFTPRRKTAWRTISTSSKLKPWTDYGSLPSGPPQPVGRGLKGMCHLKNLPYVLVGKAPGHDAALQDWTRQSSAPVAVWNEERPRTTWNEQLYLVERLAPQLSLVPDDETDCILMFGLCNELCGETGFGWSRRIMIVHGTLSNLKWASKAKRWRPIWAASTAIARPLPKPPPSVSPGSCGP